MWHRGTDENGRSTYVLAGTGVGIRKIEGLWFIFDLTSGENMTWRDSTLADAKKVAEIMAGVA